MCKGKPCGNTAASMMQYMNNCSGNGSDNGNGQCVCETGWGADCSVHVDTFTDDGAAIQKI
jgi:hypothetical protein